jgi:hypothetical protein
MKNYISILLLLCFAACEKDTPVDPGSTLNVVTVPFSVGANDWIIQSTYQEVIKLIPEITAEAVETGSIQGYLKNGPAAWRILPYSSTTNNITSTFSFSFYEGNFHIVYSKSDGSTPSFSGSLVFKVVIISGQ